jgi:D-glycero-D-manno-heptose 1,7-bisphosphate phosphatase
MTGPRRAAFLDRDGTLIEDTNYLADADQVRLLPGVSNVIREFNQRDVLVIVVTNQSGIAQGLLTEAQYEATRERLDALLKRSGAHIDATYHCPHYPAVSGPCECRKPGTLLYEQAAKQCDVDFRRSFFAGDRFRDVVPGLKLGGFARLVPSGSTPDDDLATARERALIAGSLEEAMHSYFNSFP